MRRIILALGMIGFMLSASFSLALSQEPARDVRFSQINVCESMPRTPNDLNGRRNIFSR